jgi:hypothetical protein
MDIAGFHIPGFVSASTAFTSVYAVFYRFDRIQSKKNRQFVSYWLKGVQAPHTQWNLFFLELFARLFGSRHLSFRSFITSAALSMCLVAGVLAYLIVRTGDYPTFEMLNGTTILFASLFLFTNIVSDYLSLWKTRVFLTKIGTLSRYITLFGVVIIDLAATTLLYISSGIFVTTILEIGFDTLTWQLWIDNIEQVVTGVFGLNKGFLSDLPNTFRNFYLVSLLTSAWLWMYVATAILMRGLLFLPTAISGLSKIADLDEHPVRTIGFGAGLISAVVVGVGTMFSG